MQNSLRLAVLIGSGALVAIATFVVACSDDTPVSGTADSSLDSGTDSPVNPAKPDGSIEDGGADTSPPLLDVATFDSLVATEFCKSFARCCSATPAPTPDGGADGGTAKMAECVSAGIPVGFEGSNLDSAFRDGGKVAFDQVNAASCIKKIQNLTCDLPGAELKAIRAACFGVYNGTVASGGPCTGSLECQPGQFCNHVMDAAVGQCNPLRNAGDPCGDLPIQQADEACSYRASGNTGNYCDSLLDPAEWKCVPAYQPGKGGTDGGPDCYSNLWCEQSICSIPDFKCKTPVNYFGPGCGFWK